jgi:hypothetical protein
MTLTVNVKGKVSQVVIGLEVGGGEQYLFARTNPTTGNSKRNGGRRTLKW